MSPGKAIAQAGHAFVGALNVSQSTPEHAAYTELSPGTKVALSANELQFWKALETLKSSGTCHYVVIDSGCENFFGGQPIATAIGFGPVTRDKVPKCLRRLALF